MASTLMRGRDPVTGEERIVVVDENGAVSVANAPMEFGPIYDDGTYQYFGEAGPAPTPPALTDAVWQVSRVHKTTGREQFLDSAKYSQVYTDLATVQGLFAAAGL